jgi:hypothetical protein
MPPPLVPTLVDGGGPADEVAPKVLDRSMTGLVGCGIAVGVAGLLAVVAVDGTEPTAGPASLPLRRLTICGGIIAAAALPPPEKGIVIDVDLA